MTRDHWRAFGVVIDETPLAVTMSFPGIYIMAGTFEEAEVLFVERLFQVNKHLRQWKEDTMPLVSAWSARQGTPNEETL